ncbi:hypothetical protein ACFY1C_35815 [Streptomyces sp. NPDC001279]|uniref:hypothetical protein n=1 Tax=Streptomyces sp. NPDC001279 TaxID=3364556 RepID=UPI0036769CDF
MTVTAQKHQTWAQIQARRNTPELIKSLDEGRPSVSGIVRPLEPEVPVVLDGEVFEDLERLNAMTRNQALYTTRLSDGGAVALGVFTDRAGMLSVAHPMDTDTALDFGLPTFTRVWEDANEGGDRLELEHGFHWPNLLDVPRGFLHTQNWNDIVSSVSVCAFDVSLFWDINLSGPEFFVPAGTRIPDLNAFGWNDAVSSFICWG